MNDFTFPQETDWFYDLGIFDQPQDIVIRSSGFLLCYDFVRTTIAENLESALFFVGQVVFCYDCIRTKIEKKEDETSYPA